MNIAERRLPQDGHSTMLRSGRPIDLRISVIPMVNGESVVVRILDKEAGVKPVEGLGLTEAELGKVRNIISHNQGMFLVTGPTGSGKSTTLYALLQEIRERNPHIITVEDPVEYDIPEVEQIQVAPKRGYTFAEALRHILRHDPDVIMVGEIRDRETAEIAMKAALTGHLVLTTLHTNDAVSAVMRLRDMGVPPYLISATVLGAMAQRLVRRNCPECLAPAEDIPSRVRTEIGAGAGETFYRSTGCAACDGRGYRGRMLVPEILTVDADIRGAINADMDYHKLHALAREHGMHTMTENGLHVAREGLTTLEEVYSIRLE
jgi:type IV pilus assembly protein PilB